jgi:hypothetical protein
MDEMKSKKGKKISEELIGKIKKEYDSGKSSRDVAKELGVSKTTVLEYVNVRSLSPLQLEEKKRRNVAAVQKRRRKIKQLSIEYKGGGCERCGYNKCSRALEFHHLDPSEKDFGIGHKGYTRSWEKVKKELDKCIMVCANCHAEIHEELEKNK